MPRRYAIKAFASYILPCSKYMFHMIYNLFLIFRNSSYDYRQMSTGGIGNRSRLHWIFSYQKTVRFPLNIVFTFEIMIS